MTFTCKSLRRLRERTKKRYSNLKVTVGTTRKSIATVPSRWARMNPLEVVDGDRPGRRVGFGMYRPTVSLSTSWPSLANSLAMRRRVHSGFSFAMRPISSTISASSGGRPPRRDLWAQKRANPRQCQETTLAGFTMMMVSTQRDQVLERRAQNARSTGRNRGSATVRELLPQSKVVEHQAGPWAHERPEGSEDGDHGSGHESSLTVGVDDVTA